MFQVNQNCWRRHVLVSRTHRTNISFCLLPMLFRKVCWSASPFSRNDDPAVQQIILTHFVKGHAQTSNNTRLTHRTFSIFQCRKRKGDESLGFDIQNPPSPQTLHSYPHPLERQTSRLRLLPPGPGQIHLANIGDGSPTEAAQQPPAPRDG